ncbi:PAS domain S-box protein [Desulforapulum autotrophicum]|uniref:PAS domain S-box protein n=1 Tax=Desulforapulum autotrophicum TaxID=2296 RepID=UPI00164F93E4|nr:PAS domain S-box protein [Desulforapulum autotrophicum]
MNKSSTESLLADAGDPDDLLCCLFESILKGSATDASLDRIVSRLRLPESSLADFLLEKSCLLMAINIVVKDNSDLFANGQEELLPWLYLQQITDHIIKKTGIVYERVVKHGGRAFCQVDEHGVIVYANPKMLQLAGREELLNQPLSALFDEQEQRMINESLAFHGEKSPKLMVLNLQRADGACVPVGTELAPIMISGCHHGGYAGMVDISGPMESTMQVMEQSPLGILKTNTHYEIIYANPRAHKMCGLSGNMKGIPVESLCPDRKNREILQSQMKKRFENGTASEYEIEITRRDNGQRVPVMIAAMPERNIRGQITGSLAILRSLELEYAAEKINYHIATCNDTRDLLQKFVDEIANVCPFDLVVISAYSKNLHHVRSLFCSPEQEQRFRWWVMPPDLKRWIEHRASDDIFDLENFLSRPEWKALKENPEIRKLLKAELYSIIRCPIWDREEDQSSRLVSAVTFFRRGKKAFTEEDKKRLKSLPLVKTILATLHLEEKRKLSFRFKLIKKIFAACEDMHKVANLITSELVGFYEWNNVSIFRIDERDSVYRFHLLSQKAKDDDPDYLLPPHYKQRYDQGVLSHVYLTGKPIFTGNVKEDRDIKDYYLQGFESESNSELCVPIMAYGKVFWLLNIEDPLENAFSSDEVEELQVVLGEIGVILEKAFQHHFLREILQLASDAIIVIDNGWKVRQVNPAVEKLLGYPEMEMINFSLEKIFVNQDDWQWLKRGGQISGQEIQLGHKDSTVVAVYVSTFELPQEVGGGSVLLARDLSQIKRLEELDYLGKLYYEIAIQTKTPLSLLFKWIKRLQGETSPADRQDTLSKALKQLRKLTLTYDRLVLYDKKEGLVPYQPLLADIEEILELLPGEFPDSEWQKVLVTKEPDLPLLRVDIFQLTFCLETIISYLLRAASQESQVTISVGYHDGTITIKLRGIVPELPSTAAEIGTQASAQLTETISDMALGDAVIRTFIENHEGATYKRERQGDVCEYYIEFKAEKERSLL